jgi:hypothetical protein
VALEKLNLCLVQASQYIQQFQLQIFHKPGKENIVADALSCLPTKSPNTATKNDLDLDHLLDIDAQFTASSIELSSEFKNQIQQEYQNNHQAKLIMETLQRDQHTKLPYIVQDGILYLLKKEVLNDEIIEEPWLYLPKPMHKGLFEMIHDNCGHQGLEKCIQDMRGFALYQGHRRLQQYIQWCPSCRANTPR